jgi:choline dehydrogenase-like flavoprotein
MRAYRHMASFGFMIEDSQTGSVQKFPIIGPVIRYSLSQEDADRMQRATAYLAEVFLKNGAKRVIPMVKNKIREIRNESDLRAYQQCRVKPGDIEAAAFHPLGTSRIGKNIRSGVIDPHCKVFGVEGLYVCDGSIMPSALGVNPQLTIMAFADRLAEHIAGLTY